VLKLHWWRPADDGRNAGDELTGWLLRRGWAAPYERVPLAEAQLLGAGSVLGWLWEKRELRGRVPPVHVVGAGFMHPWVPLDLPAPPSIHSVRGHLSRDILSEQPGAERLLLGDPGLLVSRLHRAPRPAARVRYGVVPHLSRIGATDFMRRFESLGDVACIDFRTDDLDALFERMRACDVILSHGLHGLIFADAFGIPNAWIDGRLHRGGPFKFHDYFSSIGRPFDRRIAPADPIDAARVEAALFTLPAAVLSGLQDQIEEAFARCLRALDAVP
jgi:pyruvyltransferase